LLSPVDGGRRLLARVGAGSLLLSTITSARRSSTLVVAWRRLRRYYHESKFSE
jgi:hypothetical protein